MIDVNIPVLRKAVEWAEAEAAKPYELSEWVQSRYILPSVNDAAFSGMLDTDGWAWVKDDTVRVKKAPECGTAFCIAGKIAWDTERNTDYDKAHEIAMDALGIDYHDAGLLFDAHNDIGDIRNIAEEIAGERL